MREKQKIILGCVVEWAPLNGITFGPRQTDPINRLIPLTNKYFGVNSKQALNVALKRVH